MIDRDNGNRDMGERRWWEVKPKLKMYEKVIRKPHIYLLKKIGVRMEVPCVGG